MGQQEQLHLARLLPSMALVTQLSFGNRKATLRGNLALAQALPEMPALRVLGLNSCGEPEVSCRVFGALPHCAQLCHLELDVQVRKRV